MSSLDKLHSLLPKTSDEDLLAQVETSTSRTIAAATLLTHVSKSSGALSASTCIPCFDGSHARPTLEERVSSVILRSYRCQ